MPVKGYELIDELISADYSWSAVGVWRQLATGRLYWAVDGGCSCSSPWDDWSEGDLMPLTDRTLYIFEKEARAVPEVTRPDIHGFIERARGLLAAGTPKKQSRPTASVASAARLA